jgi:hypothetical protein
MQEQELGFPAPVLLLLLAAKTLIALRKLRYIRLYFQSLGRVRSIAPHASTEVWVCQLAYE